MRCKITLRSLPPIRIIEITQVYEKKCTSIRHKTNSFTESSPLSTHASYGVKYSTDAFILFCAQCLEDSIGWFKLACIDVELSREN